jgi:hypothetical protein
MARAGHIRRTTGVVTRVAHGRTAMARVARLISRIDHVSPWAGPTSVVMPPYEQKSGATSQAARGWAHPPCSHLLNDPILLKLGWRLRCLRIHSSLTVQVGLAERLQTRPLPPARDLPPPVLLLRVSPQWRPAPPPPLPAPPPGRPRTPPRAGAAAAARRRTTAARVPPAYGRCKSCES